MVALKTELESCVKTLYDAVKGGERRGEERRGEERGGMGKKDHDLHASPKATQAIRVEVKV